MLKVLSNFVTFKKDKKIKLQSKLKEGIRRRLKILRCSSVVDSDGPFALRKVEAGLYGVLNQNFKFTKLGLYLTCGFSDLPIFRLNRK